MKIMITGAGGFIGSLILDHLLNCGHTATGYVRSEKGNLTKASLPDDADVIINAAGRLGVPGVDIAELTDSNSRLPLILADFCDEHQINLIHLSTPGVNGLHSETKEDALYDPWGEYERTKTEGEILLRKHPLNLKNMITILRPDFVYGPGDLHKLAFFRQVSKGWMPIIGKNGARIRPTYSSDVCRAVESALPGGILNGGLFNIAGPETVTIRKLSSEIASALDQTLRIIPLPRVFFRIALCFGKLCPDALSESRFRLFGEDHYVSIAKAEKAGFNPECGIKEGIGKTVSWYLNNGVIP